MTSKTTKTSPVSAAVTQQGMSSDGRVFDSLVTSFPHLFHTAVIDVNEELLNGYETIDFPTPLEILVHRWYPGYRKTDLVGAAAEEAIAMILGETMDTTEKLEAFRRALATPDLAITAISSLYPRPFAEIASRRQTMTERSISKVVSEVCSAKSVAGDVTMVYNYAITRILSLMGIVAPSEEKRIIKTASALAISKPDLRRIMLVSALQGVFSEARIKEMLSGFTEKVSPDVLGDAIARFFRTCSSSIPEVALRLVNIDAVEALVATYLLDPNSVPVSLRAHPSLISLASVANFVVHAANLPLNQLQFPTMAVTELKIACDEVLTLVNSAPQIEKMDLKTYASFFGEVPASSPDGVRHGLVIYGMKGQATKMEVADVYPVSEQSCNASQVEGVYVKTTGMSSVINSTLITPESMHGLANLMADELALLASTASHDPEAPLGFGKPEVWIANMPINDLPYVAMSRASAVSLVRDISDDAAPTQATILYHCKIDSQWKMKLAASTPEMTYFSNPASAVLFTSKMESKECLRLPQRGQSIEMEYARDINFIGDISYLNNKDIEQPFVLKIPLRSFDGSSMSMMSLKVALMHSLVGYDGKAYNRGDAYYAAVSEPGVDEEINIMLTIASKYSVLSSEMQADKARSWLIEHLVPVMKHPACASLAEKAVTRALIENKIDGRRLAPQLKDLYARAFFGTALVVLERFGKLDSTTLTEIVNAVPTSSLTLQANLAMASLPYQINGRKQ